LEGGRGRRSDYIKEGRQVVNGKRKGEVVAKDKKKLKEKEKKGNPGS